MGQQPGQQHQSFGNVASNQAAIELMDLAQNFQQQGQLVEACGLYASLSQANFQYRQYCQLQYGFVLAQIGQLEQAQEQFIAVVNTPPQQGGQWQGSQQNQLVAEAILNWVRVSIILGQHLGQQQTQTLLQALEQAEQICSEQANFQLISQIAALKGVLATSQGNYQKAKTQIQRSVRVAQSYQVPASPASLFGPQRQVATQQIPVTTGS
jgi:tetratricopeptide (TPR) repeat protein